MRSQSGPTGLGAAAMSAHSPAGEGDLMHMYGIGNKSERVRDRDGRDLVRLKRIDPTGRMHCS